MTEPDEDPSTPTESPAHVDQAGGPSIDKATADRLAGRICAAASSAAQASCTMLELIAEFDASGALRHWGDAKSVAHWLTLMCDMTPGVAREHVRVARALSSMPSVMNEHRAGRVSYSKVRELSRVADVLDEKRLLEWARVMTAAQLAQAVSTYRSTGADPLSQLARRRVSWWETDDGMVNLNARLTREDAAVVTQALREVQDGANRPPGSIDRATGLPDAMAAGHITLADALVQLGRRYLDSVPTDDSGEDRTLVVVHVAASLLGDGVGADVPAGTSADENVCSIEGQGSIDPRTAQRLACDSPLLPVLVREGEPLALGRTRRLVTRAIRRALRIRDQMCRYPGCHQTRHLDAHHVIHWSAGGATDLDNLVLLCRFHHTVVHDGAIAIDRSGGEVPTWNFRHPDGRLTVDWESDSSLVQWLTQLNRRRHDRLVAVDSLQHPDAKTIRGRGAAHPLDIAACTQALYGAELGEPAEPASPTESTTTALTPPTDAPQHASQDASQDAA